jgi:hypothetical protein
MGSWPDIPPVPGDAQALRKARDDALGHLLVTDDELAAAEAELAQAQGARDAFEARTAEGGINLAAYAKQQPVLEDTLKAAQRFEALARNCRDAAWLAFQDATVARDQHLLHVAMNTRNHLMIEACKALEAADAALAALMEVTQAHVDRPDVINDMGRLLGTIAFRRLGHAMPMVEIGAEEAAVRLLGSVTGRQLEMEDKRSRDRLADHWATLRKVNPARYKGERERRKGGKYERRGNGTPTNAAEIHA